MKLAYTLPLCFSFFSFFSFFSVATQAQLSQSSLIIDSRLLQPDMKDNWQTLETQHFILHFQDGTDTFAQQMAIQAEKTHYKLVSLLKWQPKEKTHIILNDQLDLSNGAANPLPYNQISAYLTPPNSGQLLNQNDWIETIVTHEYTHILHLDQVAGPPKTMRSLFGRTLGLFTPFTFPEVFAPLWSAEGLAIYAESLTGYGRNHSAIYESQMRSEVAHGLRSFSEQSYEGYTSSRWPFGQIYLYGAYFYQFIEATYGRSKVIEYITNYNANLIPWRMDQRAKRTFGVDNATLWQTFSDYLRQRFLPQIHAFQNATKPQTQTIATPPYLNQLLTQGPGNSVIYWHDNRLSQPEIRQAWPDGTIKTLIQLNGVQDLDWNSQQGLIISRLEVCQNQKLYADLYLLKLEDRSLTRLTECARLPRVRFHPNGQHIFAVHLDKGRTDLVRLESDKKLLRFAKLPLGEIIGEFDIAPDGNSVIASVRRQTSGWNLEQLNLNTLKWHMRTHNGLKPTNPQFSSDGKSVYFLAETQHQVELYSLNLASPPTQTWQRWTETLGYIHDYALNLSAAQPSIWLSEYTANQQQLNWLTPQPLAQFNPSTPAPQFDPVLPGTVIPTSAIEAYQATKSLKPVGWTPLLGLSSDLNRLGAQLTGQDILGVHRYQIAPLLYNHTEGTELGGLFNYLYNQKFNVWLNRSISAIELTSGSLLETRDQMRLTYQQSYNQLDYSLNIALGGSIEQTTYPLPLDMDTDSQLIGLHLNFNSLHSYPMNATLTDGWLTDIGLESHTGGDYSGSLLSFQVAHTIDLSRLSHSLLGHSLTIDAFANFATDGIQPFRLGGTQTRPLHPAMRLGQRNIELRGYAIQTPLTDTQVKRLTFEYTLPLATIYDGFETFPIGLGQVSARLFSDHGATQTSSVYTGIGAELHAQTLIGYDTLTLPLIMGYAKGLDSTLGDHQIYLKMGVGF